MVEARQWRGQGRQVLQVFQPENFICVLVSISFYQCQLVHIYSKAGQIAYFFQIQIPQITIIHKYFFDIDMLHINPVGSKVFLQSDIF